MKKNVLPSATPEVTSKFLNLLDNNDMIIFRGGTGTGKSTQVPQIVYNHYPNMTNKIIVTQPKTLSVSAISDRVAKEMKIKLGEEVGYKYRFNNKTSSKTKLFFETDGFFAREYFNNFEGIDVLIVDEVHERNIYIDFILLFIKNYLSNNTAKKLKENNKKFILLSATIELPKYMKYFNIKGVKIDSMDVEGRTFPIDHIYSDKNNIEPDSKVIIENITNLVNNTKTGDIIVFVMSKIDTIKICEELNKKYKDILCLHLYSGLSDAELELITSKDKYKTIKNKLYKRKIVLSTNIAETGVTIDGLEYVIDTGKMKQQRYSYSDRMNILESSFIPQSSIKQRCGRVGRTMPGTCYHLYTKKEYDNMNKEKLPDIYNSNIDSIIISLLHETGSVKKLLLFLENLIDPIKKIDLKTMISFYTTKGIITKDKLSPLGILINILGMEPEISLTLIASYKFKCIEEILPMLAIISQKSDIFRDIFIIDQKTNINKQKDNIVKKYGNPNGELFVYKRIYDDFNEFSKNRNASKAIHDYSIKNKINTKFMISVVKVLDQLKNKLTHIEEDYFIKATKHINDIKGINNPIVKSFVYTFSQNICNVNKESNIELNKGKVKFVLNTSRSYNFKLFNKPPKGKLYYMNSALIDGNISLSGFISDKYI